jgi:arabinogalactan oligomer/maltooligosaccharide transport system substrate-binding protein
MLLKNLLRGMVPLAMLLAMALTACGGSSQSGTNLTGTIVIWHNWQGDYLAEKQRIFDHYMSDHPGVKIELVHQDNLIDKSIAAVNAGNGPDIIAWVDDSLGKLAKSRIIVPIDQYASKDFVDSTYVKPAAQAVEFDGHIYGIPESVEAITMMYNTALVQDSDLPKTTDDLTAFQKSYSAAHPGSYGVVWNTQDAYFDAPWFYGFGGYYVKEDGTVGLKTDGSIAAAKFIAAQRDYLPKQLDYNVASALFSEGKAAAIINGPWSYADYKKAGIKLGFHQLPTANGTPAAPFVGVKTLMVTKLAKNVALDVDFMKFYTNTANQVAMGVNNKEIPSNAAAQSDSQVQNDASIAGYASQSKTGVPLPNTPFMSALWKPTADGLTAIWTGAQTPEAAMADAQTKAESEVAKLK